MASLWGATLGISQTDYDAWYNGSNSGTSAGASIAKRQLVNEDRIAELEARFVSMQNQINDLESRT